MQNKRPIYLDGLTGQTTGFVDGGFVDLFFLKKCMVQSICGVGLGRLESVAVRFRGIKGWVTDAWRLYAGAVEI